MGLKAIYTNESDIPEGLSSYYTEQSDGSFKIDLDGGVKTRDEIEKLEKALKDQRSINEENLKKLSKIPDDFDPEQWDKVKDYDPSEKGTDKDSESVKAEYSNKLRNQKKEFEERIAEKERMFKDTIKEREIKDALIKNGVTNPLRLDDAVTRLMRHHDVEVLDGEEGKYKVVAGTLRDSVDEYAKSWAQSDEGKNYVSASSNSGNGAAGDGGVSTGMNPFGKEHSNLTKQGELIKSNPSKARSLAKIAGWNEKEITW